LVNIGDLQELPMPGSSLREIFRRSASETAGWGPAYEASKFPGHRRHQVSRPQPGKKFWKTVSLGVHFKQSKFPEVLISRRGFWTSASLGLRGPGRWGKTGTGTRKPGGLYRRSKETEDVILIFVLQGSFSRGTQQGFHSTFRRGNPKIFLAAVCRLIGWAAG
jgi:hypothetical protein